jgi:hypothetical protein
LPQKAMNRKSYLEMTSKQLAETTKKFEEPFVVDQSRPLSSGEQEQWKRVKRQRGRPKVGAGYKRISVSIEKGLLRRITALAKKRQVSRSQLFASALEGIAEDACVKTDRGTH